MEEENNEEQISNKKEGLSTAYKWAIGLGVTATIVAATATTLYIVESKRKSNEKLFFEDTESRWYVYFKQIASYIKDEVKNIFSSDEKANPLINSSEAETFGDSSDEDF